MKNIIALLLFLSTSAALAEGPALRTRVIDHTGITVPDLKEAKTFFQDIFGCYEVNRIGPYKMGHSMSNDRKIKVSPRAESMTLAMLDCGTGTRIELFEYKNSKGKKTPPDHEDMGGHHLAFYVEDINESVKFLRSKGLTIIGEPMEMTFGDTAGETWVHFMSPWGLELELVESPKGKAYHMKFEKEETLITRHFEAINERSTEKRNKLIDETYVPNIRFIDPFFEVTGREKVSETYDNLHKKFPDHKFRLKSVDLHHHTARVHWQLVDKNETVKETGEDIIVFTEGKIGVFYVFIDKK